MKEKTAELKEKIEKDYKDMMTVINSTSLPLFIEDTIEDMHILIETLIAENKELKEEVDYWRHLDQRYLGNTKKIQPIKWKEEIGNTEMFDIEKTKDPLIVIMFLKINELVDEINKLKE